MARAGGITNAVNVGIAVQADWENREFISHISLNVRRLFEFLLQFEATTKSKLASLNEKLDTLERRLELLEVQVGTASANPSLFNWCCIFGLTTLWEWLIKEDATTWLINQEKQGRKGRNQGMCIDTTLKVCCNSKYLNFKINGIDEGA
ncbi:protein BRICK 1 isoform X1 [Durio zibethinus]|uniref:Protein BRICK 1 isoform X1 n=1 Tax=Durio zibethinus TaxID=66656 RepID=A0A6P6BD57_DURZI|nr:protein BRICK 1 isoform X1 [Durio zibethinus]